MSRPSTAKAAFVIDNDRGYDLRGNRVGKGPLVELWISQHDVRSCGIKLTAWEATALVEALNDLLDEIEGEFPADDAVENEA